MQKCEGANEDENGERWIEWLSLDRGTAWLKGVRTAGKGARWREQHACVHGKLLQSCLTMTIYNPMFCSPPSSPVHGIFQARILEWVAMPACRGSSRPRDQTHISCGSCIAGRYSTYHSGPGEAREQPKLHQRVATINRF